MAYPNRKLPSFAEARINYTKTFYVKAYYLFSHACGTVLFMIEF